MISHRKRRSGGEYAADWRRSAVRAWIGVAVGRPVPSYTSTSATHPAASAETTQDTIPRNYSFLTEAIVDQIHHTFCPVRYPYDHVKEHMVRGSDLFWAARYSGLGSEIGSSVPISGRVVAMQELSDPAQQFLWTFLGQK